MKMNYTCNLIRGIIVCLFLFAATDLRAQGSNIKFEHVTLEQGLSHADARYILQDSKGFLWVGTINGLNKYDGYSFTVYNYNPDDPNSLSNNSVFSIFEDRQGMLWIATSGGGLNRFDRETEVFKSYQHQPGNPSSIATNFIESVYEDRAGNLWICTQGGGLNLMDRKTETFKAFRHDPRNPNSIRSDYVKSVYEDKNGTLWIASDGGLCRLKPEDKASGRFSYFLHNPADPNSLPSKYVKCIVEDEKGDLWIATDGGVVRLKAQDSEKGIFRIYQHNPLEPESLSNNYIKWLFMDSAYNLWVASDGGLSRLSALNRENGGFENFHHEDANPNSVLNNYLKHITQDRSGILWIAGDGGINKYDSKREMFRIFRHEVGTTTTLMNSMVKAFAEDKNGNLWVGTSGGLSRLDKDKRHKAEFITYHHNPENPNSLSSNYITALCADSKGILWIGTDGDGGLAYTKGDGIFKSYRHDPKDINSLVHNGVITIFEDSKGSLWIGTWVGISRLDRENRDKGLFKNYSVSDYSSNGDGQLRTFHEDAYGTIWAGTRDGLVRYDAATDKFIAYRHDRKNPKTIASKEVYAMAETSGGDLWIGTYGAGLDYFDRKTQTFTHYTEAHGLSSNFIAAILVDAHDNLWISTSRGISKFTPPANKTEADKAIFRNFDVTDGLQANQFNEAACYKNKDGEMYFGGPKGFNVFYPDQVKEETYLPPVYITDFKLFNKSVKAGAGSVLDKNISETQEIVLSYLDNFFSFDFAALNYRNAGKNKYAYKMDGFDKDWIYTGADKRFATYTNLSPGEYTFRVKGSNNHGVWNEKETTLHIIITPPFWATMMFKVFITLFAIGSVVGLYKYRVSSIEARRRVLEKQVKERTAEVVRQKDEILHKSVELEAQKNEIMVQHEELEQQQEEIIAQRDYIEQKNTALQQQKSELERSYSNIKILSDIGQKITALLNLELLISTVYASVNNLMDATAFGIGIYMEREQVVRYTGFIEKGETLPAHDHRMDNENDLTVYCVKNNREIIVNDLENEWNLYFTNQLQAVQGDIPESLIYLPLHLENRVIGIITVQSFRKNAYNNNDVAMLRSLASYVAIALDNANAYHQIANANKIIENKTTKIMDSIRYGKTIQQAILPNEREMNETLHEYFVIFKPRDLVSGDFYWFSHIDDKIFAAVVDCTGHGVPGAFMSMIGNTLLNEAVNQKQIYDPAQVLEYLHNEIRVALKQEDKLNDDGMDICLCLIEPDADAPDTTRITFAGAKRPLYYTHLSDYSHVLELAEIKGDKKPIGGRQKEAKRTFTSTSITLSRGDMVYLTSDGFSDQSNAAGNKFGIMQFKQLLLNNAALPAPEQKEVLLEALQHHQKDEEQRDDITIMGIRV